jgi:hypothetical protein
MKKEEIESIVETVRESCVSFIPHVYSESVAAEKIKSFIENLDKRGINVVVEKKPVFEYEDVAYHIKTYKIDEEKYPLVINNNVDTVFLYQWFNQELPDGSISEIIRFATKEK